MAYDRFHINSNGSFNTGQKQSLLKTFDEVAEGTVSPQAAPAALTNSTTGTTSNTLAALAAITSLTDNSGGTSGGNTIAVLTAATLAADAPTTTTVGNAIATLAAKQNVLLAEYPDIKNAISSLGDKINALRTALVTAGVLT
jgi:hypothetical protein